MSKSILNTLGHRTNQPFMAYLHNHGDGILKKYMMSFSIANMDLNRDKGNMLTVLRKRWVSATLSLISRAYVITRPQTTEKVPLSTKLRKKFTCTRTLCCRRRLLEMAYIIYTYRSVKHYFF